MDRRVLLIVITSSLIPAPEQRRYSMSERISDGDVLDEVFGREPRGDYIVAFDRGYDFPYGRIDRDDVKLVPDHHDLDRPAPSYGGLRTSVGGRIRGHQVLVHRKPVWRRS